MKKMLKGLSVLEIIIGILAVLAAVGGLAMGRLMEGGAENGLQMQAIITVKASAILGLISGLFNLDLDLVSIVDFGGWVAAYDAYFTDGAVFDQIYGG